DPVKYDITVKNVQEEVLPELTEEFIRKVDESATNESELRERVLERIQARLSRDSDAQLNEAIIDYFVQRTDMEVPPSMVERYVDRAMEEARSRDGEKLDEDRFRHEVRPRAIRNLKWYLIRKALLGVEELEVSDEELARKIDQLAEVSPGDEAGIRRFYRKLSHRDRLRNDLTDEKLFAVLTSCGKIDEVKVTTKDVRHQRALSTSQIG
ncbi:MAG: hypothetical protein ACE5GH_07345, partial [Fidelibacterota bacterium]